jgi:hypothetical protein
MFKQWFVVGTCIVLSLASALPARAHCDTMSGPVVAAARVALERADVAPVLKWIKPEAEAEVRSAFARALAVRGGGAQARELADIYFFETLVRLHRSGEGAPYTGLKPAGTPLGGAVEAADRAIELGSADALVTLLTARATEGLRQRFARVSGAKPHAEEGIEHGRAFVEAYVEFVHYVESLDVAAGAAQTIHEHGEAKPATGLARR